jgi:hypothetical protein
MDMIKLIKARGSNAERKAKNIKRCAIDGNAAAKSQRTNAGKYVLHVTSAICV